MEPQQLKQAIEWAKKNPNDPRAKELRRRIESGKLNAELKQAGMKTFEVKPKIDTSKIDMTKFTGPPVMQRLETGQPVPEQSSIGPFATGVFGEGSAEELKGDIRETAKGIGSQFMDAGQDIVDTAKRDDRNFAEKAVMIGGRAFGGGSAAFGELITGIGKMGLTQEAENQVADIVQKVAEGVAETEIAQDAIGWYNNLDERDRDMVDAAGGFASFLAEVAGLKGAGKIKQVGTEAIDEAAPVIKEGVEQTAEFVGDTTRTGMRQTAEVFNDLRTKNSQRIETKNLNQIAEQTQEPLNKKGRIDLLKQTTGEKGATKEGLLAQVKAKPDAKDLERAKAVQGLVETDPLNSITNINQEIARISNETIRPHLRANPRAFNTKTVNARLNALEKPLVFKTEKSLENTYDLVREKMIDTIAEHPKTMEGLYDARIAFDQAVKREFGDVAFGDPKRAVVRRAIQDIRREVNDFIGEEIGDDVIKESLRTQHLMFEAAENIAESNNKIFGTNRFQRWAERNPNKAKTLKWGAVLGTGAIGSQAIF